MRFADRESSDRVAGKIKVHKLPRALAAQVGVHAALHDAEQNLAGVRRCLRVHAARCRQVSFFLLHRIRVVPAAARPLRRALHRCGRALMIGGIFDALVEHHGDVRTQRLLNFNRFFRRKKMFRAVQMRAEDHAFVRDFSQIGETENLKAARIGEDRSRPGHEAVQAAEPADAFVAGTQIQMIGVAEQNLHAQFGERLLGERFHRAGGSHGHERGRVDHAVRRRQSTEARAGRIRFQNFKMKIHR